MQQPTTTIAILGADTVVGSALCALLEGSGYRITPIDSYPTGVVDDLLDGADLLLLAPRLDEGAREAFLGAMGKSKPQTVEMPVISLSTTLEEGLPEKEGVIRVPWPCETKALVQRIEATLAGEGCEDPVAMWDRGCLVERIEATLAGERPNGAWAVWDKGPRERIEAALLASAASTSTIPQAKSERA